MPSLTGVVPDVFSDEREAQIGALPEQITIKCSTLLANFLQVQAISEDRDVEWIARRVLEKWAESEREVTTSIMNSLVAAGIDAETFGDRKTEKRAPRRSEADVRNGLAEQLQMLGLSTQTEVGTGSGNADIVIYNDANTPVVVVEVKLELKNWRSCHQATGQAMAYAKALGAKHYFAVAPEIDPKFVKGKVLNLTDGTAALLASHVKPMAVA